jgi:hypothetical protein
MSNSSSEEFRRALDNACGEINEAARLSGDVSGGEELAQVRRDLARLIEQIDSRLLSRFRESQVRTLKLPGF